MDLQTLLDHYNTETLYYVHSEDFVAGALMSRQAYVMYRQKAIMLNVEQMSIDNCHELYAAGVPFVGTMELMGLGRGRKLQ